MKLKYIIPFCLFVLVQTVLWSQPVDTFFVNAPRYVLPVLDKTTRLDLLDLYANKMPAKLENSYGGEVCLAKRTEDYLQLRMTSISIWTMKLVPLHKNDTLIFCTTTLSAVGESSRLYVCDKHWNILKYDDTNLNRDIYCHDISNLSFITKKRLFTILRNLPVRFIINEKSNVITSYLEIGGLSLEDRNFVSSHISPVDLVYKQNKFFVLGNSKGTM